MVRAGNDPRQMLPVFDLLNRVSQASGEGGSKTVHGSQSPLPSPKKRRTADEKRFSKQAGGRPVLQQAQDGESSTLSSDRSAKSNCQRRDRPRTFINSLKLYPAGWAAWEWSCLLVNDDHGFRVVLSATISYILPRQFQLI